MSKKLNYTTIHSDVKNNLDRTNFEKYNLKVK